MHAYSAIVQLPNHEFVFIGHGDNQVTVSGNSMINAPSDAIDIEGGGVVSANYISGTTWGKHPDAVWITNTSGPISLTDKRGGPGFWDLRLSWRAAAPFDRRSER